MAPHFTRYYPSVGQTERFKRDGNRYLHISHWKTNLEEVDLRDYLSSSEIRSDFQFDFGIEELPSGTVYIPELYLDLTNQYLRATYTTKFIGGRHLRIALGTPCETCSQGPISAASDKIVNIIRLHLGLAAALSCSLASVFNIEDGSSCLRTDSFVIFAEAAAGKDDPSAMTRFLSSGVSIPALKLPADAEALFLAAMQAKDLWARFLYLWMGIEILVHSDGRQRSKFCRLELRSTIIDKEMFRLRNVRASVVHNGFRNIDAIDLTSVLWLFRICCLPRSCIRDKMCSGYEEWLKSAVQQM